VHALYAPGGAAVAPVVEAFPGSLAADGGIDRAALSAAVAAKGREEALRTLECIVHPLVTASRSEFVRQAQEDGEWLVVVDVPLLLETNKNDADLRKQVDLVLVVSAGEEEQRKRVLRRPGMTPEKLDSILARQVRMRADVEGVHSSVQSKAGRHRAYVVGPSPPVTRCHEAGASRLGPGDWVG